MSIYTIVGLLFVSAVSMIAIYFSVNAIIEVIKNRKTNVYEEVNKGNLYEIERWCDYDFPQVGFVCRELLRSIEGGWIRINADELREKLRKGEIK
jgi:hypothetical protein